MQITDARFSYQSQSILKKNSFYTATANMAMSQAANVAERIVGHGDNADIATDVTNYAKGDAGEETSTRIKATTWQGKKSVKIGALVLIPFSRLD